MVAATAKAAFFPMVFVVAAALPDTNTCVFNGGQAISDLMDAAVYTWAASQRCSKGSSYAVKCEVDVAQAVESANEMVNFILRTVHQCGSLNTTNPACGIAAGRLTARFSGLAAASGEVVQQCRSLDISPMPSPAPLTAALPVPSPSPSPVIGLITKPSVAPVNPCAPQVPPRKLDERHNAEELPLEDRQLDEHHNAEELSLEDLVTSTDALRKIGASVADSALAKDLRTMCALNIKDSVSQIFRAATAISAAKENCPEFGSDVCAYNALGVIEALAGVASYLMGAVGHCNGPFGKLPASFPLACSGAITKLVRESTGFAAAATEMSIKCGAAEAPPEKTPPAAAPLAVTTPPAVPPSPAVAPPAVAPPAVTPTAVPPPLTRLYAERIVQAARQSQKTKVWGTSSSTLNIALAAFLPITAIASFAGGMRLRTRQPARASSHTYLQP